MADQINGGTLDRLLNALRDVSGILLPLAAFAVAMFLLARFLPKRAKSDSAGLLARLGHSLQRAFTTNWQLTLLATTAFVLSLASG